MGCCKNGTFKYPSIINSVYGLFTLPDTDTDLDPNLVQMSISEMGTVMISDLDPDRDPSPSLCNKNNFCT